MARLLFRNSADRLPFAGRLGWRLEAALLKLFWRWSRDADPQVASRKGYRLFRRLGPCLRKNRHVIRNLEIAFPELTAAQRADLAGDIWANFGAVLAEYPYLPSLARSATDIDIRGASRTVIEHRQPAVYITAHVGNWEIAAATIARLQIPFTTIYSPQSNPYVDHLLQSIRASMGVEFVSKRNAIRQLVREIRHGRSVGMLPDQRITGGEPVPFFGLDAETTTSPAWLAIKMNCPLIPIEIERLGCARFCAHFHEPLDTHAEIEDRDERVQAVTRDINRLFEQWIRQHPGHWLCSKRRWPRAVCRTDVRTPA